MVKVKGEVRQDSMTRFIFAAPNVFVEILIILALSLGIDILCWLTGFTINSEFALSFTILGKEINMFGLAFSVPAILSIILTKPLVDLTERKVVFKWKRAGLLALVSEIFMIILMLTGFLFGFDFAYIFGIGFIFAFRIIILCGVVDYRVTRMLIPAVIQSAIGFIIGVLFFGPWFMIPAAVSIIIFGLFMVLLVYFFDLPLKKTCGLSGMEFANVFFGMIDGSNRMEKYLGRISEYVTVPETTFFFKRDLKKDVWFVVPNLHPGPMAEIGGSNIPKLLHDNFENEAVVLVSHGCASHDLNLISNSETSKIIDAIKKSKDSVVLSGEASRPVRSRCGAVSFLSQRFGDSILMVTTRSPDMTEDMDYSIGRIIMGESRGKYANIGFVDAHNCMLEKGHIIYPSTEEGNEFITGGTDAILSMKNEEMFPLRIGVSSVKLPYTAEQGFGDMELITLVTEAGGVKTAYVLFDGNNVKAGVRDILRDAVLKAGVDEAEIMSTDTHVVNTLSGMNPVGHVIGADEILPYVLKTVSEAIADLGDAKVGAATGSCENVEVFGPGRITQLTALSGSIITNLPIYLAAITIISFLAVMVVCWVVL
ncbi:MAG: DUF2070 family protein [Methanocorpusculum sp.]|nr:DUF2070 family protein [Methanocorpusculum sp.]